jgi:hypothetical protein
MKSRRRVEGLVVWSPFSLSWGSQPRPSRLDSSMIRIIPYVKLLHRWVNADRHVTWNTASRNRSGYLLPLEKGLRRDFLSMLRTRSGSSSPLMRAFAGLKPLLIRFTSPSLPMSTTPYPLGESRATTRRRYSMSCGCNLSRLVKWCTRFLLFVRSEYDSRISTRWRKIGKITS